MISFCRHSIKKQPHTSISYFKIVFLSDCLFLPQSGLFCQNINKNKLISVLVGFKNSFFSERRQKQATKQAYVRFSCCSKCCVLSECQQKQTYIYFCVLQSIMFGENVTKARVYLFWFASKISFLSEY